MNKYNARTREDFIAEVKNSTIKREQICKSLDLTVEQFQRLADAIITEWDIADENWSDYNWKHLLNVMRVKAKSTEVTSERINRQTLEERKQKLLGEIKPLVGTYGRTVCNAFYNYWSETDNNQVMRFEKERTFNTAARLKRWAKKQWTHLKYP